MAERIVLGSKAGRTSNEVTLARIDERLAAVKANGHTPEPEEEQDWRAEEERRLFIDWSEFWGKDRREAEWVFEPILARGRGHAFYAKHKVGKSLVFLWMAAELATQAGVLVLYFDYEMGEDDLYERLEDMGYGAETDLSRLRYALLPSLPPLDQPEGAKAMLAIIDAEQALQPDLHVVVAIDTMGRAVSGEENSADTIRNFYRWTGLSLKQRGVTWARLDHAGKDGDRGQRGSSAKGDDVDVIWNLAPADDGLVLKRDAARMSWVPERVALRRGDEPLRFMLAEGIWPAGTKEVAALLEGLGVTAEAGSRPAGKALREAGHKKAQSVVQAAQKWRRQGAMDDLIPVPLHPPLHPREEKSVAPSVAPIECPL